MRAESESHETLPDVLESTRDGARRDSAGAEPRTLVRKATSRPTDTFWEARLVLSTLDPKTIWSGRLRLAIRQGNRPLVNSILASIFEQRSEHEPSAEHPSATYRIPSEPKPPASIRPGSERATSTLLPPPSVRRRASGS